MSVKSTKTINFFAKLSLVAQFSLEEGQKIFVIKGLLFEIEVCLPHYPCRPVMVYHLEYLSQSSGQQIEFPCDSQVGPTPDRISLNATLLITLQR